jgi:hypothetical protein
MTVKKVKKEKITPLKTKLDDIFSLYIRLREATDEGLVQCFTCGKVRYLQSTVCRLWTLSCLDDL